MHACMVLFHEPVGQPTHREADGDQTIGRQNKADRDGSRVRLQARYEWKAQVERAVAGGEPTGTLNFVDIRLGGNSEIGLASDTLHLIGCRLQEVDPLST